MQNLKKHTHILFLVLSLALTILSIYRIDHRISGLETDGRFNFSTAFSLLKYNTFSYQDLPTAYREPLPAFFYAASMKIFAPTHHDTYTFEKERFLNMDFPGDAIIHTLSVDYYRAAKYANIFFIFIAYIALSSILTTLNFNILLAIFIYPLVYFLGFKSSINYFFSEIHTISLLLLSISLLIKDKHILSGITFGLLVLTKGVFLYLVPIYLIFMLIMKFYNTIEIFKILVALYLVILPWQIRNFYYFDSFSITNRSGLIMLIRAYANQMSFHQISGFIADQSPPPFSNLFSNVSKKLGGTGHYLHRDKQIELQNDPEEIQHFYHKARAQRIKFSREESNINQKSLHHIDKKLKEMAIPILLSHPIKHILMSFVFAYRGFWNFRSMNWRLDNHFLLHFFNILCNFSLIFTLILGIKNRDKLLLQISVLPILSFCFYSFTSHFIPRYFFFFIPFQFLCLFHSFQILRARIYK